MPPAQARVRAANACSASFDQLTGSRCGRGATGGRGGAGGVVAVCGVTGLGATGAGAAGRRRGTTYVLGCGAGGGAGRAAFSDSIVCSS
jgi:hypothetical protein